MLSRGGTGGSLGRRIGGIRTIGVRTIGIGRSSAVGDQHLLGMGARGNAGLQPPPRVHGPLEEDARGLKHRLSPSPARAEAP